MSGAPHLPDLAPDCSRCFGLCCVALPLTRSADFPVDKPAGEPCRNLLADDRCRIHDRLRETGWKGFTVFDCVGAGKGRGFNVNIPLSKPYADAELLGAFYRV